VFQMSVLVLQMSVLVRRYRGGCGYIGRAILASGVYKSFGSRFCMAECLYVQLEYGRLPTCHLLNSSPMQGNCQYMASWKKK